MWILVHEEVAFVFLLDCLIQDFIHVWQILVVIGISSEMWREPHNLWLQDGLGLELAGTARSHSGHLVELGNLHRLPRMKLLLLQLLFDGLFMLRQAKQIFVKLLIIKSLVITIQYTLADFRRTRGHVSVQEPSTSMSLDG